MTEPSLQPYTWDLKKKIQIYIDYKINTERKFKTKQNKTTKPKKLKPTSYQVSRDKMETT